MSSTPFVKFKQDLGDNKFALNTAGYGMTESGIWVPIKVTDEGDQKVQLSGTIVRQAFGYVFGPNCVVAVGDEAKSTATANEIIPLDISSCNHIQVYFKNLNPVNLLNLKLHFTHDLQPRPLTYEGGVEGAWFTESIAGVALPNTEYWVYVDTTNPDKTDFLHRKAIGLILEWKNVTPSGRACDYSIIGGV